MAAAKSNVERDEEIAVFIASWPEDKLVIIARAAPLIADGHKLICDAGSTMVDQFGQFGSLADIDDGITFHMESERFVQPGRKSRHLQFALVFFERIVNQPHFASTRAGQKFSIRPEAEPTDFEDAIGRLLDGDHAIMLGFCGSGREICGGGSTESRREAILDLAGRGFGSSGFT